MDETTLTIGPVLDSQTGSQIAPAGTYNPRTRTITWFVGEVGSKQGGSTTFTVKVKDTTPDKSEAINYATVYFPSVPEATRTNGTVNRVTTFTDNVPPTTTGTVLPLPNQVGWNNSDITITLTATDNQDGSGVKELYYKLSGATQDEKTVQGTTAQITISNEGTTTLTYFVIDNIGNIEESKSQTFKLDKTPPTVTAVILPEPNSNHWNNSDATVSFAATDSLSGIASVTQPQTVTSEGKEQHIGGEAQDLAGNTASTYATLNIDKTPPTITAASSPQPNSLGWNNFDVTVSFNAEDNLSGIQDITQPITVTQEGANQFINGQAIDYAGNSSSASVTLNIDNTPPAVTIVATPSTLWPPNNKMVNVAIAGSTADNLSGITTTAFKVEDEYDRIEPSISGFGSVIKLEASREGSDKDGRIYIISVTTKDKADNATSASATVICPHDQGKK